MRDDGDTTWEALLGLAVRVESTSGDLYHRAAGEFGNVKLKDLFESLADAKSRHADILKKRIKGQSGSVDARYNGGLPGYIKRGEELSTRPGSSLVVVEFAINFEEEAIRFYEALKDKAGPDLKPVIQRVIAENLGFVESIRTLAYETLTGFRSPV